MNSHEIRKTFLEFFAARGHRVVRSSSLVPANDPTLLFTNAGMNQFKDVFLGREKRDYERACSSQKCVRAGGKHNDLEQVGRTRRHHTFFEMLGNFSFGNYFKKDAIAWAWELVTRVYQIPREKLYVTAFEGASEPHADIPRDQEAYDCWLATGAPAERIFELGMKENFWQMGETGPCGPCSEIHYDMGPEASDLGHTDCKFPCDCGRYVEIWNLVFMQYDRQAGEKGGVPWYSFSLLPKPCVDTGAGLERLAAVLQGKLSNFDTDLFKPLIDEAAELANVEYGANHETDVSLRIIADHSRAATFLISDGVLPSNEGRGYVLRRIIRRALYHGQRLGINEPFLDQMSSDVVGLMKGPYPELIEETEYIRKAVKTEEERYEHTTRQALDRLRQSPVLFLWRGASGDQPLATYEVPFGNLESAWRAQVSERHALDISKVPGVKKSMRSLSVSDGPMVLPGDEIFKLHDTYGLSPAFLEDIVSNSGVKVDLCSIGRSEPVERFEPRWPTLDYRGYEEEMRGQRERARASWRGAEKKVASPAYRELADKHPSAFDGYARTESTGCLVAALVVDGESVQQVNPGAKAEVILDHTPFYAEAGGQIGDTGRLYGESGEEAAAVTDTFRPVTGLIAHKVTALQPLDVGMKLTAKVDAGRRDAIRRNHTATHLLHAALRTALGTHVKQAGSLVAPDRLRFDFTHYAPLEEQDRVDIEDLVNRHILANEEMHTDLMDLDSALNSGAMALFGEKYGDQVRVVSVADG
ncbi:MAG: alanine--tRNA ligase, partial [Terriglobia bacterium]